MEDSKLDLVLTRACRHFDWVGIPDTSIEFCRRCGFAVEYPIDHPPINMFDEVQGQPQPGATFDPTQSPKFGARSYVYEPLRLERRQIRVLVLKAGQYNHALRCELKNVDLQQSPVYEALSYTWADETGDDTLCRAIECGPEEKLLPITRNCEAALRRLRKPDIDRQLWVDAICIDQTSIKERNHQVKNMMTTFRGAIRVIVFLGEGNADLARLVDYISNDTAGQLPKMFNFVSLFKCRWFYRVWVLQEVAVAKSVIVVYGTKTLSWTDLMEHRNLYLRLMASRSYPMTIPPVISFGLQQTTTKHFETLGKSDLLSLLGVSRNSSCKDARDKVYAIIGLLRNQSLLPLRADYAESISAGEVFLKAAAHHIISTGSIKILTQVEGLSRLTKMPSWVPDWTVKSLTPLPAQIEPKNISICPKILDSQCMVQLFPRETVPFPLNAKLQERGQKFGTVWTDETILDRDKIEDTAVRLDTDERHWLLNPSPNTKSRICPRMQEFWKSIFTACPNTVGQVNGLYYENPIKVSYPDSLHTQIHGTCSELMVQYADIPSSFGGSCEICYSNEYVYLFAANERYTKCLCGNAYTHYDNYALQSFITILRQHSTNRRLFGTDHTLGLGPKGIRNWDQIWVLDGMDVPVILRPVKSHYMLIGTCYVHLLTRTIDKCSIHGASMKRTRIHDLAGEKVLSRESHPTRRRKIVSQAFPCKPHVITIQ